MWAELLLQWPLCMANFYGIVKKRSWVKKTCLIYGISAVTSLSAILSELIGSGKKGSLKLVGIFYVPFMVVAVICILNGLNLKSSSAVNRTISGSTEEGPVHLI
ncbi:hypothetical protein C5167_015665 [Papaver somniferum]|uniref:EXPERA domain-containing protein n=1 Tax=Papaver somniferum TaxID=3469 RepID=A0A4Y7JA58_PAPSO|nr:hypothetical protein C5167_015665 [Papaver somniferum]